MPRSSPPRLRANRMPGTRRPPAAAVAILACRGADTMAAVPTPRAEAMSRPEPRVWPGSGGVALALSGPEAPVSTNLASVAPLTRTTDLWRFHPRAQYLLDRGGSHVPPPVACNIALTN